jgi:hypothetical protein
LTIEQKMQSVIAQACTDETSDTTGSGTYRMRVVGSLAGEPKQQLRMRSARPR